MSLTILNESVDSEAAALVAKAYGMITPHWQALIPALTVMIASKPFNHIPELREFCEIHNKQPGWRRSDWKYVHVACPDAGKERAVLWVRYDHGSMMYPPGYYFQKKFFAGIAQLIWYVSEKLRAEVKQYATGMAAGSDGAAYLAFRDTFSRFFLNPEYLKERREEAWDFIAHVDQSLANSAHIPA